MKRRDEVNDMDHEDDTHEFVALLEENKKLPLKTSLVIDDVDEDVDVTQVPLSCRRSFFLRLRITRRRVKIKIRDLLPASLFRNLLITRKWSKTFYTIFLLYSTNLSLDSESDLLTSWTKNKAREWDGKSTVITRMGITSDSVGWILLLSPVLFSLSLSLLSSICRTAEREWKWRLIAF